MPHVSACVPHVVLRKQANLWAVTLLTRCNGIIQSDMIIQTAIEAGLEELRAQPWLLDFALQFYLNDELTVKAYGEKNLERAKNFFLTNDVQVRLDVAATQAEVPTITITSGDGQESWTTLADVADTPVERVNTQSVIAQAPALTFTPVKFEVATGTVTLNDKQSTANVYAGMRVLDTVNSVHYAITEVLDDQSFIIDSDPDSPPSLKRAQVVDASDLWVVTLQSATHRETYQIMVEVQGEPIHAIVLHSMLMFILYRYKKDLLHKRGFENVNIAKSALTGPYGPSDTQLFFRRGVTVTGHVTHTWPDEIKPAIQGVNVELAVMAEGSGKTWDDDDEGVPGLDDQGWRVVDPDLPDDEDDTL